MPRDYKYRAQSRRRQSPPFVWFVAGLLVGAAGVGLVWLKWAPPPSIEAATTAALQPSDPQPPANTATAEAVVPEKDPVVAESPPRFEYYSVLPEMEVVIPPEELRRPTAPPAASSMPEMPGAAPQPVTAGNALYLLQLGSFRSTGDADRLKASLALIGIAARVEKVTIDDKGTYYRVRSGPYGKEQAYNLHKRLEDNRVESMIVRLRG